MNLYRLPAVQMMILNVQHNATTTAAAATAELLLYHRVSMNCLPSISSNFYIISNSIKKILLSKKKSQIHKVQHFVQGPTDKK